MYILFIYSVFCLLGLIVELASSEFIGNESSGSVNVLITKSNALSNATISVMITLTEQSPISATGNYMQ